MYLAPLNYDRFFKKVFSSKRIAKQFLEDFFDIKIQKIEITNTAYKITDDAVAVVFDYRCKINGQYIIIDMQQWYKTDVIKRFYVYHTLNTAVQLETLLPKVVQVSENKKYTTKDYEGILPVYTLIWMADDDLGFKEDFVTFALSPEQVIDFIRNEALWKEKELDKILEARKNILTLLDNKTKNLDFLPENKLTLAFQKKIILNNRYSKYFKWFDIAEKSRNKNNTRKDFALYEKDKILMAVMQRIRKDTLMSKDYSYIKDLDGSYERGVELGIEQGIEKGVEIGESKKTKEIVIVAYLEGFSDAIIAKLTKLPVNEVETIIEEYKAEQDKKN
jgi:hypothetical protein